MKKLHWTQTPEGKARMGRITRKTWRKKRALMGLLTRETVPVRHAKEVRRRKADESQKPEFRQAFAEFMSKAGGWNILATDHEKGKMIVEIPLEG